MTMLLSLSIFALIDRAVFPCLFSVSFLKIVNPLALILRTVYIVIGAKAVRLVVLPLAIEDIAIYMIEDPTTMSLIVHPFAFVFRSIWPGLFAIAMPEPSQPLPTVDSSIFKCVFSFFAL